ncbi:MAG: AraC family transcriptional regulator [Limnobacter sp.]|jgi:AraC-like DNA-binding protein|uniref:AraC family transcriptional regulator n=2 Tax=Burkholderiaceae TaxID=119060 RepID=UPI000156C8FC|nr:MULTISPECIES: AraC family transcriptional regulator [Limnobacter]EDM84791.1 transcriptional regulator, AraC family protein [Limnobacter sp. MED105]MAZ08685.1 AraC family transcriptional regulator [Sutterellaceae bacterium]MBA4316194.1 AraC family transcriptional regulator [Alcaligenaceae bacterium]MDP3272813.1 AraC family transcriptional regulator [Limnobacter sp.]|tara:strand:- start:9191 stop:10216 length:1026 start_codon:yes stop_codon:yes gene_type:complete
MRSKDNPYPIPTNLGNTVIHYIPQIAEQLNTKGLDVFGWLAGVGLDVTCLTKPGYEVPVAAYSALLEQAIELTGDSGLGLRLGCNLVPSAHGNVGLAALSANTIQESMQIVERYVPLRTSLLAIRSETVNDEFRVVFEPIPGLGEIGNVVAEIALGTVKNIIDATVASNSPCQSILFSMSEPSHAALSRELLGCEVLYGQSWTGISLNYSEVLNPLSHRDALVMSEALSICQRDLERLESNHSIAARLERLLLKSKQGEFPNQHVCAQTLNMTPRTFHRRLRENGTSYRDVLNKVRCRLAHEYLKMMHLGVKETAYLLGYGDIANFRRAFTRWYGFPPSKL